MKMTYEEATKKSDELFQEAVAMAERHGATGTDKWAFVAGCLKADVKMLLAGTHRMAPRKGK